MVQIPSLPAEEFPLAAGARQLIESAAHRVESGSEPRLAHWLAALLERHSAMAEAMVASLDAEVALEETEARIVRGEVGPALSAEDVVAHAVERAKARGKSKAAERDFAAAILEAAGYALIGEAQPLFRQAPLPGATHAGMNADAVPISPASGYVPRNTGPTPMLDSVGRDLTRDAATGKLAPVVGRDNEMQLLMETLCRRTKRNPALVGPAGAGKTSIVEGLALRIVRGDVPAPLRGARLIALQPSMLVAGASIYGELDQRMQAVLDEATGDGILLFIDELHSIVGAGGREGSSDVASQLKPALARGEIACIAATTDDEYRRFIEVDAALERRFQPIRVQELTPEQTLDILKVLRDEAARERSVHVADEVLGWLLDFASRFLRNRTFPDKAVDLLEQCIAHALTLDASHVGIPEAETVAGRMVGMPLDAGAQIDVLKHMLTNCALLSSGDADALAARLQVTMRGLDLRASRPNAVLLLAGEAEPTAVELAETIAESLFGDARVVTIDFGQFLQEHDVAALIGAPPGYIGYSHALPIHSVVQTPWCVLHCDNVHACHPHVRNVLAQALADGYFTDSRGKRIYLSDTVVLLSAGVETAKASSVGFRAAQGDAPGMGEARQRLQNVLGEALVRQADLVVARTPRDEEGGRIWAQKQLLDELVQRYHKHGLEIHCDSSLIEWLARAGEKSDDEGWERLVDEGISPLLIPHLATRGKVQPLLLRCEDGVVRAELYAPEPGPPATDAPKNEKSE